MGAAEALEQAGVSVRVVSMPCADVFLQQPQAYQDQVIPSAVTARVAVHLDEMWDGHLDAIDILRPIFYRNKGAYLVGRLRWLNRVSPIVIPLLNHEDRGVHVDAVLLLALPAADRCPSTVDVARYDRRATHVDCVSGLVRGRYASERHEETYTKLRTNTSAWPEEKMQT